jgi:hypothetical protein
MWRRYFLNPFFAWITDASGLFHLLSGVGVVLQQRPELSPAHVI